MQLVVQKYGGTSVGSPEKIKAVAQRIARYYSEGKKLIVVVSAMGHTTDELIQLAHQISTQPPHREMDMLLTVGERVSMALLSIALSELQVPAISFTGSQSGIITDTAHRRARIKKILGDRARAALDQNKVVIIAGFQGVSEEKEVTTLGRGGSDTTAVALAAVMKAQVCEIYTDVDGIYTADPRVVERALFCKEVSLEWMAEMASHGAKVLHPRSVELALQYQVPLYVKNSLKESDGMGSMIRPMEHGMEEFKITGVTSDTDKVCLYVKLARPTVVNSIWDKASQFKLSVLAPMFSEGQVWFFVDREFEADWKKHLNELQALGFLVSYEFKTETVPLSVIGHRFAEDGTALFRVLEILAENHIPVVYGAASGLAITVGIPVQKIKEGVKILHQEFVQA